MYIPFHATDAAFSGSSCVNIAYLWYKERKTEKVNI